MRGPLLIRSWALLAAVLAACRGPFSPPEPAAPSPRLAVFSAGAAETLERLGAVSHVVAVGKWVRFADGRVRPQVGTFDQPNAEVLLSLGVELVVTTASVAGTPSNRELERLGLEVLELETATLEGVFASIQTLGRRVGRASEATCLVQELEERLQQLEARRAGAPRLRALIVVGRDPLWVAGPGSYLDRLLAIAGAVNAAAGLSAPFAPMSLEKLLEQPPHLLFDLGSPGEDNRRWEELLTPALGRKPQVVTVPSGLLTVPGPRVAEMAEYLAGELDRAAAALVDPR